MSVGLKGAVLELDADVVLGQVHDVADGGLHGVVGPEIFIDRLGLCGRLNDDEGFAHCAFFFHPPNPPETHSPGCCHGFPYSLHPEATVQCEPNTTTRNRANPRFSGKRTSWEDTERRAWRFRVMMTTQKLKGTDVIFAGQRLDLAGEFQLEERGEDLGRGELGLHPLR